MKKISFDFDSTLDNENVQRYAHDLIQLGYEIHIVTARPDSRIIHIGNRIYKTWDNDDLYQVSEVLNIKRENIHFMGYEEKYKFSENKDFIFHLDDDFTEIEGINSYTKTKGIPFDDENWMDKCNEILKSI